MRIGLFYWTACSALIAISACGTSTSETTPGGAAPGGGTTGTGGTGGPTSPATPTETGGTGGPPGTGGPAIRPEVPIPRPALTDGGTDDQPRVNTCLPGDMSTFKAIAVTGVAPAFQNKCTDQAIADGMVACLAGGPAADCETWKKDNADCSACMFVPADAAERGPLLPVEGRVPQINSIGCFDHFVPGGKCGAGVSTMLRCMNTACDSDAQCKDATSNEMKSCVDKSKSTVCKQSLSDFVSACPGGIPKKATMTCFPLSSSFDDMADFLAGVIKNFCGAPPTSHLTTDGGAPPVVAPTAADGGVITPTPSEPTATGAARLIVESFESGLPE